jgi:hypothetical protein
MGCKPILIGHVIGATITVLLTAGFKCPPEMLAAVYTMIARAKPFTQGPCTLSFTVVPRKEKSMTPRNSTSREIAKVLLVTGW